MDFDLVKRQIKELEENLKVQYREQVWYFQSLRDNLGYVKRNMERVDWERDPENHHRIFLFSKAISDFEDIEEDIGKVMDSMENMKKLIVAIEDLRVKVDRLEME